MSFSKYFVILHMIIDYYLPKNNVMGVVPR